MDFDELEDPIPKPQVPRFLPKPKGKLLPQKKSEPAVKSELVIKPEPQELSGDAYGAKGLEEDRKLVSIAPDSVGVLSSYANVTTNAPVPEEDRQAEPMDVDDYVIREIDVYFNPQSDENTQMYVMQYPLRPSWRPYDLEEQCKEVRLKPKSAKVEIDIEVPESFDGLNTTTKTLSSSGNLLPKIGCTYAIGVLRGDKLHLNPLHAIVQLRPSTCSDDEEEEEEHMNGTKILEDFDRKRSAASSKNQGKTLPLSKQNTNDKESWVPLKYHCAESDLSTTSLQMLMAENHSPIPMTMSPTDYLNSICPGKSNDSIRQPLRFMRSLLPLPLEERFKKWFCEGGAPAYRFSVLKYLAPEVPPDQVIQILDKQAVLVQGLWVPKNLIVLPHCDPKDPLAIAREYVIWKFSQKLTITYDELAFKGEMNVSLVQVLRKFAIQRTVMRDWKFKESPDPSFTKDYSEVAEHQRKQFADGEQIMIKMEEYIPRFQKISKSAPSKKISLPAEKREAVLKALEVLFKKHSVNSYETICRGLRDMAVSKSSVQREENNKWMVVAASCVDGPREELEGVIKEFATFVHGAYVAKSSILHPDLNPLRNVVIQLFLARPPNDKLVKAHVMEGFRVSLRKDNVSDNDYLKVMNEICESRRGSWVLKSPAGR
uniref:DNA-directed RNA polymerase III subunit RPC5 n=1 Tax=Kalanchoe fedtschenkoi TaxID=63787 RepID=A0A7N0VHG2_KALFE